MNKFIKRIKNLLKRLMINIKRPEMRVLPGQLAFFFFLTLIPLLTLIGVLISLFKLPYSSISDILTIYFPKGTESLLVAISSTDSSGINMVLFFITSLFLSSNATHSMIITSNQIYNIKNKDYIKTRLKALAMMILVLFLFFFILFIPVFGDLIFKTIELVNDPSAIKSFIITFYSFIKYPLSLLFIYFIIKYLYIMSPNKKIPINNVTYGAIFTSFSWVLVTKIYSFYVSNLTNYSTFYGGISSILILLIWLYFLSYIFVLGMALNVSRYELLEEQKKEENNIKDNS